MNKPKENSELVKVCNDCGRETDANAKFCSFCGEVFVIPEGDTNERGSHSKQAEKPKQTSPWMMIIVACILLFVLIYLVFFMPWRMPFSSFSK